MRILQLAPLFKRFREKVEDNQISLEESIKTLSYASELVVFKLESLLPSAVAHLSQDEEPDEICSDEAAPTYVPVMDQGELRRAALFVGKAFGTSAQKYGRGAVLTADIPDIIASIDPVKLAHAMRLMKANSEPAERVLRIPKFSFVSHLRSFWSEVRRLAGRGAVLRFSRFLGKTKAETIMSFLVFLELIKRRRVFARQKEAFGEIMFSTAADKLTQVDEVQET